MALTVRKVPTTIVFALATAFNAFVRAFVTSKTTFSHFDITSTPGGDFTAPTSTALGVVASSTADLPAVIVMAEEMRSVLLAHYADPVAHKVADTANLALIAYATIPLLTSASSQADTDTLLNAISTSLTAHEASTTVHPTADATNAITAPAATNLATSKALAADERTQIIAHILLSWPSPSLNLVAP